MDIRQIRYFLEVALSGSFKSAAAQMNISQSSLSRRVAELERSLNVVLLVRHPRGISLTRSGQLFLDRAAALMREFEAMQAEVTGRSPPTTDIVTVGSAETVSRVLLAPLAATFRGPPDSVALRFVEGPQYSLREGLDAGRIDIALMTTPAPVDNCRMEVLQEEPLFLISKRSERPRGREISIAALDKMPVVLFPRPSTNRDLIERIARKNGVTLDCRYEIRSSIVQVEFVRAGLARAILPHFAVADHIAKYSLATTPIRDLSLSQTLVWRRDRRQKAAVSEVAEVIRRIFRRRRIVEVSWMRRRKAP